MKQILLLLIIVATATHCSKPKDDTGNASLVGMWELKMQRGDPGDGSGHWVDYTGAPAHIEFQQGGIFFDSRSNLYNRYSVSGDTITLSNSTNSETSLLLIQELTASTFTYYYGGFWCGGPSGDKFVRIGMMTHQ